MVERHGNGSGIPEHLSRLCSKRVLGLGTLDSPESLSASLHGRSHYVGYLHWQRRSRLLLLTLGGYSNLVPRGQYLSLLLPILGFFLRLFQAKDL
jgi:hypothetical protein